MGDNHQLFEDIISGDRVALSRGITLIESNNDQHQLEAERLLRQVEPGKVVVPRIAISGPPGVGKSTVIESLGLHLIEQGKRVAVLTIDPSSQMTHGSILGDKTRMERLSKSDNAFIRQTPSSSKLGGIAPHTRETIWLCELAGFDMVLVETVGVGQSEYEAHKLCDIMIYLGLPGSGDELQGVKKGILEVADVFVINKADGAQKELATITRRQLKNALHLGQGKHEGIQREVLTMSALEGDGIVELWDVVDSLFAELIENGILHRLRQAQLKYWLFEQVRYRWMKRLENSMVYQEAKNQMTLDWKKMGEIYDFLHKIMKEVEEKD